MNIVMVHGSNRRGNTDKTLQLIKETLIRESNQDNIKVNFTDIHLPKDLPVFCKGCFVCIQKGDYAGEKCPHKEYTHPILKSFLEADGIVFGSPSYALTMTGQLKSLFDHFAGTYTNHRPNEEMFDKIGFVVTTAAGAGTHRVVSSIKRNMLFWGIKRRLSFRIRMWVKDWKELKPKQRAKIEKNLDKKSVKFYKLCKNRQKVRGSLQSFILMKLWKKLISGYDDDNPDKIYWKSKGWIN